MVTNSSYIKLFVICALLPVVAGCHKKNIKSQSHGTGQVEIDKHKSGKEKISKITAEIKHDVVSTATESVKYAQAANLAEDLNVDKIADFFEPKTFMGKAFLIETLKQPVSPEDTTALIAHRQAAIIQLVNNPDLKKEVEAILRKAAVHEQEIMELMSDFFIGKTCPELQALDALKKTNPGLAGFNEFCQSNTTIRSVMTALNIIGFLGFGAGTIIASVGAAHNARYGYQYGELVATSVYCGLLTALYGYVVYDDCSKASAKRKKIHALNQLVCAAESIERLSTTYNIDNQFKMSLIESTQGTCLIKGLKNNRYTKKENHCFSTASVHTFLYKIYKNDAYLAQMFASIGEMDAYNAIANKMIDSQNGERKFCYVQFKDAKTPEIDSKKFWNVLVPHAVVNSLSQDRDVVLTGPNAGGKTTAIRAILQNILLAQTYGIAAAESFSMTQFDVILSYLNISDDLIKGYSLFASEIKRAEELTAIIKGLLPSQKLFFALDELFTGTGAQKGEECAYRFIQKVATFDRVLFIYATHFEKLKELGDGNAMMMNYKVDAPTKNELGKLVYPFTLSAGASNVNVALDMAQEAGLFD